MRSIPRWRIVLLAATFLAPFAKAQQPPPIAIQVRETVGIRRFGYPVTARIPLPANMVREPVGRLTTMDGKGKLVPAQLSATAKHPDGSVKTLEADFILSPGPLESTQLQLELGDHVTPNEPKQGLTFEESPDAFQVSAYRIRKDGQPLIASVRYGREYLKQNGFEVVAWEGDVPYRLRDAKLAWTVEKRGPLQVRLRCQGRYVVNGAEAGRPFAFTLEFVSSKSWVGVTHTVSRDATDKRKVSLGIEGDFAMSGRLLWDQDVGYWLYGVLEAKEHMSFMSNGEAWRCLLGPPNQASEYAVSSAVYRRALGWGHFQEARENGNVVAFGISDLSTENPGERSITLQGDGRMTIRVTPEQPGDVRVQSFFHFIPVPAQHTARTSPAAMMTPLEVTVR